MSWISATVIITDNDIAIHMTEGDERSSIDAKGSSSAASVIAGAVLMVAGMLIGAFGIWCIVEFALGYTSFMGLIGGMLIMPVGVLLMAIGGALLFFGTLGRFFGKKTDRDWDRKRKRILY